MKVSFYLFLLFFLTGLCRADQYIDGIITDEDGIPIADVLVTSGEVMDITDTAGYFRLPSGSCGRTVKFHKIGYRDIEIDRQELLWKTKIELLPIEIEGIKVSEPIAYLLNSGSDSHIIRIDSREGRELEQIIREEAGLNVIRGSSGSKERKLSQPGYKSSQIIFLLNDIPLNEQGQSFDISTIPVEMIESVEIIRGGRADLVSGGIGTIVILRSRDLLNIPPEIFFKHGSFSRNRFAVSGGGKLGKFKTYLLLAREKAENDFKYEAEEYWEDPDSMRTRSGNDYSVEEGFLSCEWSIGNIDIKGQQQIHIFDSGLPGPTSNPELFKDSRLDGINSRSTLSLDLRSEKGRLENSVYYFYKKSIYDNTKLEEPWSNLEYYFVENRYETSQAGSRHVYTSRSSSHEFKIGLDLRRESFFYKDLIDSQNTIGRIVQWKGGIHTGLKLQYDREFFSIISSLGGRYQKTSELGNHLTGVFSPVLQLKGITRLKLGFKLARALVLPSFYDLYWKSYNQAMGSSDLFLGEPDLKPEVSISRMLFAGLGSERDFLYLSYRIDDIDDMIILVPYFGSFWKPMNLAGAKICSLELRGRLSLCRFLEISGNYLRTWAEDRTRDENGEPSSFWGNKIMYTPEFNLNLSMIFLADPIRVNLIYSRTGEQWTTRDQLSKDKLLDEFSLLDLDSVYTFYLNGFTVKAGIGLNNILDERYEYSEYMPEPGFNWDLSIKISFRI